LNEKSWRSGYNRIFDLVRLRYDTTDMARHRELKMLATKPEVEITLELFPLPVFVAAILNSGCRTMLALACLSRAVKNVWEAVEI
jgi:hypothetical protein